MIYQSLQSLNHLIFTVFVKLLRSRQTDQQYSCTADQAHPSGGFSKCTFFSMFQNIFLRIIFRRESTLEMFAAAYGVEL